MARTSPDALEPAETNTVQAAVLPSAARAVMVAVPGFLASTRPLSETPATLLSDDDQLTAAFAVSLAEFPSVSDSSLLLSLSVPLDVLPRTSSRQDACLPFAVDAVIVALPALTAVTSPSRTVTTASSELVHVTAASAASAGVTVAESLKVLPASSRTVR